MTTFVANTRVAAVALFALAIVYPQLSPPRPAYTYGVVSIHPSGSGQHGMGIGPGPQGGMRTTNTPAIMLLTFAYDVRETQFANAPNWVSSDHFDVTFTPDKAEATPDRGAPLKDVQGFMNRNRQRMQSVLRDRFGLVLRLETRELPVYALVLAKKSPKLSPSDGKQGPSLRGGHGGTLTANGATIKMLADSLSSELGRPVNDETGLSGQYDFKLQWDPRAMNPSANPAAPVGANDPITGVTLFNAVADQLGLRLESKKGPVQVYVIAKIEKPSAN